MNNTKIAVATLKQALKLNGYTYKDVAKHLGLSEASIKKMFATHHFTLQRMDMICAMLGMDFMDLVRLFDASRQQISTLSIEQENELVADKKLFLVAICARNHWLFDDILNAFDLTKAELLHLLRKLESLLLLELHPNNRIRLQVAEDFRWLVHGPIERFFEKHLLDEFLMSDFDATQDMRLFLHGPLTSTAQDSLNQKLNVLAHEFAQLMKDSADRPHAEKNNVGLLFATRQWEANFVTAQRKHFKHMNKA